VGPGVLLGLDAADRKTKGPRRALRTIPLPGNLIPRIAVTPRVVVNCLFGVDAHIRLVGAAAVQVRDVADDLLVLGRDLERLLRVRLVVDARRGVLAGVGVVVRQFLRVGGVFVGGGGGLGLGFGRWRRTWWVKWVEWIGSVERFGGV